MAESKIVQHQSAKKNIYSLSSLCVIHFGRYSKFYCITNTKKALKKSLKKSLE